MKKVISQISLILLIIVIGMTSVFITQVNAASMIGISVSSAKEGENFTVKLVINDSKIAGVDCKVEVVFSNGSKATTGTGGENGIAWAKIDGETYGSDSITFNAKVAGTATVRVTGINVCDADSNTLEEGGTIEKTITIAAKPTQTTTPDTNSGSTSTGNSSSSNNNSSNNSSSNNNSSNKDNKDDKTEEEKEPEVKNPTFKEVNETVYAVSSCNVRSSCSTETSSNKIGGLSAGQAVTRTGVEGTWSRIKYNGKTAYVATRLLTTEKPEEKIENKVENTVGNKIKNTISNNTTSQNTVANNVITNTIIDGNEQMLNQIEQEIGVLPEVGNNIATNLFVIISIISLIIIMKLQYKSEE